MDHRQRGPGPDEIKGQAVRGAAQDDSGCQARPSISMGPATAEAPYINAAETRPLEAGMVLAMEVPCYIDGVNGFNIEDMVLITENGCEVLTPCTPHYL